MECERVGPKLKIALKNEAKEWRNRVEQTKVLGENIKKILPDARNKLEKLTDNISKIIDKI